MLITDIALRIKVRTLIQVAKAVLVSYCLLAIAYWLLAIGYCLLAIGYCLAL
ncbi:hypothetical protein BJP36_38065 [Moorena producens JHB]|uniref:Uncharacterized protein n=1 Tax=Moorena producens (strain JHB) TaxID=1454205 RepID=A0A9Q9SUK9_MOOP1|nr:hypothetical protein [Moorena producens]WAN69900.1 hypothetical protein BJP36_38065 [Moorena producens JHB]